MLLAKFPNSRIYSPFRRIGGLFLLLILFSCNKPTAQYPSNKEQKTDSIEIYLRDYNKDVIAKEDSAILAFISNQPVVYKKSDSGIWYFIQKPTENPPLTNDSSALISYKTHTIRGELLFQENEKTIHFGKKEVTTGLEEGLKLMKKGETARFLVPSFLAYGAQGTEIIPPYSPIIYVVESK